MDEKLIKKVMLVGGLFAFGVATARLANAAPGLNADSICYGVLLLMAAIMIVRNRE